jgi:hypothetical protein
MLRIRDRAACWKSRAAKLPALLICAGVCLWLAMVCVVCAVSLPLLIGFRLIVDLCRVPTGARISGVRYRSDRTSANLIRAKDSSAE